MALAPRLNRVSLAFMGEGWNDAYINFRMVRDKDQQMIEQLGKEKDMTEPQKAVAMLKALFVSGKGLGEDGQVVDISVDDFADLDLWTLNTLVESLGQSPDPKAPENSSSTTPGEVVNPIDSPGSSTENASA